MTDQRLLPQMKLNVSVIYEIKCGFLLFQLIRHYEIGWNGGVLDCKSHLINKPDKPLYLTFKERSKVF
jgi:hypothetical protein